MKPAGAFRHYYGVFQKWASIIALIVVMAVGCVVYQLANRTPQYQAGASMLVTPQVMVPTALEVPGVSTIQSAYRETVQNNIIYLLRSRTILERVAEQVGGLSAAELARRVTVKNIRGTDFLLISAVDEQPGRAALIANAMAQELVNFFAQIKRAEATNARKFIEEQLGLAQDRLRAAEQALLEFQTRTKAVALPEEVSRTEQRILDLQIAYEAAVLDESNARTRVAAIQSRLIPQNGGELASISIATNPVIAQIRDHLTGLELELANLHQAFTDQHPKVQALLGEITADRDRLGAEAAKVLNGQSLGISPIREQFAREMINAEVDASAARARAAGISSILGRLQAGLNNVPNNELALVRLQRDVNNAEQLLTRLSSLHQEALVRESDAGSSGQAAIVVVDQAMAPDRPVPNQLPRAATLAGLLGLFVGAALAVAVEYLDDRIRVSPKAEDACDVPVRAAIPTLHARSRRYLTTRPEIASVLLSLVLAVLMLGLAAGLHPTQVGAMPANVVHFSQALMQAFHTAQ